MPTAPGPANAYADAHQIRLGTGAVAFVFARSEGEAGIQIRAHSPWFDQDLALTDEPFVVEFASGRKLPMSKISERSVPVVHRIARNSNGANVAETAGGQSVTQIFSDSASGLRMTWRLTARHGSNYIKSELSLSAARRDIDISRISLVRFTAANLPSPEVVGRVPGSPIVSGNWFFGFEHPMATSEVANGFARSSILRKIALKKWTTVTYSAVFGASPEGQMRRGFARYIERERARPVKPFLHYNSWYDIGYFTKYDEAQCLDRIRAFGEQLTRRRGVTLDSFMFDDGWDDTSTVWEFHKGFPNGFAPLKSAAAQFNAGPGIWLSPWGGYGGPRDARLKTGRQFGYEVDNQGYALSGPKYYAKFREACLKLVTTYGVNQFKLDGTGSPDKQVLGSPFASDFEAAIQLIKDLRVAQPQLFVNLTTGTWPSPFWARYADSIWRGGYDHGFAGVGSDRQKWITYRDSDTFHGIVTNGPLYPLNSLMLHGLIFAQHAGPLSKDPGGDFRSEVRSYFGSGTQLQEMYITPSLLSSNDWNTLAETAKWARANADVMRDVHWVGGDPNKLEIYGWAAWTPRKAIITLRNPSNQTQAFSMNPQRDFELPANSRTLFDLRSVWPESTSAIKVAADESSVVVLNPFEVITLESVAR